jgi:hypothetical protein
VGFGPPLFFVDSLRESRYTDLEEIHMTITKLIERLEEIRKIYGDLQTFVDDGSTCPDDTVLVASSLPTVAHYKDGYLIFEGHPSYSESLQKVVWL